MRPNTKSFVTKREGSPYWQTDFWVNGKRIRESTDTVDQKAAEIIAFEKRQQLLSGVSPSVMQSEMKLDDALARFWLEHGRHVSTSKHVQRYSRLLLRGLGANTLLSKITAADVASYVARRRIGEIILEAPNQKPATLKRYAARLNKPVANATVDNELILLRAVLRKADRLWGIVVPRLPWEDLFLRRSMRQRILTFEQEARLFQVLWPDLHPVLEFALATGLRLANVIQLRWEEVDWTGERLEFRTKSIDPEGAFHYLPITNRIRTILEGELGRHPVYVFTFVCRKNRHIRNKLVKGERYPFSYGGWRDEWLKALKAAGLWDKNTRRTNFRFHDLRHTAATRTHDRTNNLKLVQEMLGHSRITTTERYAKLAVQKLKEGMEETDSTHYRHRVDAGGGKPKANGHAKPKA